MWISDIMAILGYRHLRKTLGDIHLGFNWYEGYNTFIIRINIVKILLGPLS